MLRLSDVAGRLVRTDDADTLGRPTAARMPSGRGPAAAWRQKARRSLAAEGPPQPGGRRPAAA
jgi:hypothetical protein